MKTILEEQEFQQSDCVSDECLVQAGQLLGVTHIIAGTLGRVGKTFTINLRMIDVGSGEIAYTDFTDCDCDVEVVLSRSTSEIAQKMAAFIHGGNQTAPVELSGKTERDTPKKGGAKRVIRIALGAIAITGVVGGLYWHLKAREKKEQADDIYKAYQDAPVKANFKNFKQRYDAARKEANKNQLLRNVSLGIVALGTVGFTVTFAF